MNVMTGITRRKLLKVSSVAAGAATAGGLMLKLGLGKADAAEAGAVDLNIFIEIDKAGLVTLTMPSTEMGQDIYTGHCQILAEELDGDWKKVRFRPSPVGEGYRNPMFDRQATGGSTSVRAFYQPLRVAGATAREMLKAAAAATWGVAAADCTTKAGRVLHAASGRSAGYGELAAAAAKVTPPAAPALKSPADFSIIGKRLKRVDTAQKINGAAQYAIDIRLPGMLTAAVRMSPVFGGEVVSFDDSAVLKMPGVKAVLKVPGGVAVAAGNFWQAQQAAERLPVTFSQGKTAGLSSAQISAAMHKAAAGEKLPVSVSRGDAAAAIQAAARDRLVSADYELPYLAHATMQPITATASVKGDRCEMWCSSQSPEGVAAIVAETLGIPLRNVAVHTQFLGGGFGRGSVFSAEPQAAVLSKALGCPVKVIWSRENDIQHDVYRPSALARMTAVLGPDGLPQALKATLASPSIAESFGWPLKNGVDKISTEGLDEFGYDIPHFKVEYANVSVGVPVGFWRSVGNSHNAFFKECFIDELAAAAGKDPYEYRRALLKNNPRALAVLDLAAKAAGWGTPLAKGRARGMAFHAGYGSIVAEVAEVSLSEGRPRVERVVVAADCGTVINPASIEAQIESAIVYGLTAALKGRITLKDGAVEQSNFFDYEMLKLSEMPVVETHLMASSQAPGGVGEIGTPPIAPAVANALFSLTGKRVRNLPIET